MFEKGENPHHPQKGEKTFVSPITDLKEIKRVKKYLSDNPRNLCLFTLGINTGFRISDILQITVRMVKNLSVGDELIINEMKTKKQRRVNLNHSSISSIQNLLSSMEYSDDDFLFIGKRGNVLTVPTVSTLMKMWCKECGLDQTKNYGSHTLRKTWGYHQRVSFGSSILVLMESFGHSTQKQTLDYLCIQPEEVKDLFKNEL